MSNETTRQKKKLRPLTRGLLIALIVLAVAAAVVNSLLFTGHLF